MVENTGDDADLLRRALRRGDYELTCDVVETLAALALVKTLRPDVPFIIVSDDLDLHLAASLMKWGAPDDLPKWALACLMSAIARALREVGVRRVRQQVEAVLLFIPTSREGSISGSDSWKCTSTAEQPA